LVDKLVVARAARFLKNSAMRERVAPIHFLLP
jgi:hypothetical protein